MSTSEKELLIKIAGQLDKSLSNSLKEADNLLKNTKKGLSGISATTSKMLNATSNATLKTTNLINQKLGKTFQNLPQIAMTGVSKSMTAVNSAVKKGLVATGAGLTAFAASAIKTGSEFEAAMAQVKATMLLDMGIEKDRKAFELLETAAKEMGRTTRYSSTESAEALNYLALAGYSAEKSIAVLPTILNLASAGAMELQETTDMITDALSSLNLEPTEKNIITFSDQLAKTASKSNTSVQQLVEAILTVGGTAKTLPGGLTEINTNLGILADNGIKAREGGTALRNVILRLTSSQKPVLEMLDELGIKVADANGDMRSMKDIMTDLTHATAHMGTAVKSQKLSKLFNTTDLAAVQALMAATTTNITGMKESLAAVGVDYEEHSELINQIATDYNALNDRTQATTWIMNEMGVSGEQANLIFDAIINNVGEASNRYKELGNEIENSAGAAKKMADIQNDVLKGDLASFNSAFEGLQLSFFSDANVELRKAVQLATKLVGTLQSGFDNDGIYGMVAAIGPCLNEIVAKSAEVIPKLTHTGITAFQSFIDGFSQSIPTIANSAADVGYVLINGFMNLIPQIYITGINVISEFSRAITDKLPHLINNGTQALINFAQGITAALPNLITYGLTMIDTLRTSIVANMPQIVAAGTELILNLVLGLINATPMILTTIADIGVNMIAELFKVDWLDVGVKIIQSIVKGLISLGAGLVNSFIGLFTGKKFDILADILEMNTTSVDEYLVNTVSNIEKKVANIKTQINLDVEPSKVDMNKLKNIVEKATGHTVAEIGIDFEDPTKAIAQVKEMIAAAEKAMIEVDVDVDLNAAEQAKAQADKIVQDMGIESTVSMDLSIENTNQLPAQIDELAQNISNQTNMTVMTPVTLDPSTVDASALVNQLSNIGGEGATAFKTGFEGAAPEIISAVQVVGDNINTTFQSSYNAAQNTVLSAMQQITSITTSEAQRAANAIKSAFESMTITIPKPKIPKINVSHSNIAYGDGGNVSVPNFDVSWHAKGGVFTKPTVFNTPYGLQGFGEAGNEAILPLNTLWVEMEKRMKNVLSNVNPTIESSSNMINNQDISTTTNAISNIKNDVNNIDTTNTSISNVSNIHTLTKELNTIKNINNSNESTNISNNFNISKALDNIILKAEHLINSIPLPNKVINPNVIEAVDLANAQPNNLKFETIKQEMESMPSQTNGENGLSVKYSPVYNFYSNEAPNEKDIKEAGKLTQSEFDSYMERYLKSKKRKGF